MGAEQEEKLPIVRVIQAAFVLPWSRRKAFAKALALPLVALGISTLIWQQFEREVSLAAAVAFGVGFGVLFSWLAVACHRLVLLRPTDPGWRWSAGWSRRETRFFLCLLGVYLIVTLVAVMPTMIIGSVIVSVAAENGAETAWLWSFAIAAIVLGSYVLARSSLIFPAVALDGAVDLKAAWRRSRNNGWRLTVVVAVLPWCFSFVLDVLQPNDPSLFSVAVFSIVGVLAFVVEITALSLAYWELGYVQSTE